MPPPARVLARFRARIEPILPTRKALALLMIPIAAIALGLQLLSHAVTDDATVRSNIATSLASGEVFDLADPESGNERFSECMALSILAHEAGKPDLRATLAMEALKWDGATPLCKSLGRALADEGAVQWFSYSRYWHGSLTMQRLWLDGHGYASLMALTHFLALASLAAFGLALAWRVSGVAAAVTVGLGYFLSDLAFASHLPTQGISLAALFGGVAVFLVLPRRWNSESLGLAAFAVGTAYNYFDFLYNPGLLAGLLGWSVVLTGIGSTKPVDLAWRAGGITAMALTGYIAMWAAKWLLCCLYMAGSFDFFAILGPSNAMHWALGGEAGVWPLEAIWILTGAAFRAWWSGPVALAAIALALAAVWQRRVLGLLWLPALPLGLTLLTLELASGHSVSHGFTVRAIPWVVAAFCGGAAYLAERGRRRLAWSEPAASPVMAMAVASPATAGD